MLFFLISQCNLVCFACLIKINNFQKCLGLGIWLISERQKSKLNTHTNGNQSKSIILNFDTYHLRRTFVILKDINRERKEKDGIESIYLGVILWTRLDVTYIITFFTRQETSMVYIMLGSFSSQMFYTFSLIQSECGLDFAIFVFSSTSWMNDFSWVSTSNIRPGFRRLFSFT